MAPINEIVDVQISRGSVNISQVGFGTIMILGGNANFSERLQFFSTSDLSAIADALLSGTDALEYKAAQAICSQNPRCTQLAIGHRASTIVATFAGTLTGGNIVAIVNGVTKTVSFNADVATTLGDLATAIATVTGIQSAVYGAGAITIIPSSGYVIGLSITINGNPGNTLAVSYVSTETETVTNALNAIQQFNTDWYGLILASRNTTDVGLAAAWVEAATLKIFVTSSADPNVIAVSDTTSIAYLFKQAGYLKSQVRYSAKATTEYADAALLGKILPYNPGSYTAAFKQLAGVSTDLLTTTQRNAAFGKDVDVYVYVGGVNITLNGRVAGGEYLDVMIFVDWLQARCTEAIYQILVNNLRVPYTDAGIASVENALTQPLKAGQNAGGISPTAYNDQKAQIGGFYITVPRLQDIPTIDKTNRTLNNVVFVAFLAGAIQKVAVRGTVTL